MNVKISENLMFASVSYTAKLENISNDDLYFEVLQMRKKDEGITKSNTKGWHSNEYDLSELHAYKNIFLLNSHITELVNIIASSYGIKKKMSLGTLWCNINGPGSSNKAHCHPGSKFSAVYYVRCDADSGDLIFERPDLQPHYFRCDSTSEINYETFVYKPFPSMVCIFPSYLIHSVDINNSNIDRISLAFNFS